MDINIWVAMAETFPDRLAFSAISFWITGTLSMGNSIPMSPRATVTPSTSAKMESRFATPSARSNFAMSSALLSMRFKGSLACWMSSAERTKDTATQSTS